MNMAYGVSKTARLKESLIHSVYCAGGIFLTPAASEKHEKRAA